ncbi:MAG: hypothetical protein PUI10_00505 [Prevotellaceae bacterium]|nr:hypothetical protein [Prevotellaceae bacterium]MDD7107026.1 hypothetical protein [Prevotellaceae bacterium]
MKTFIIGTLSLLLAFTLIGCSEDEDKSQLPVFSEIAADRDVLRPGDVVTFTAVQTTPGNLINRTSYTWKLDNETILDNNVIYDNDKSNPTCQITIPEKNSITVTFKGSYNPSASQWKPVPSTQPISGGSINYTLATLKGEVTINKTFRILR